MLYKIFYKTFILKTKSFIKYFIGILLYLKQTMQHNFVSYNMTH